MRIGFNGLFLREKSVGIGKYSFELLRHFVLANSGLKLYVEDEQHAAGLKESLGDSLEIEVVKPSRLTRNDFIRSRLWEYEMFKRARTEDFDVFHSPYYVCSPYRFENEIVTIHDVIHIRYPEYVTSWPRSLYWSYNKIKTKALTHILTDSYNSRDDIVAHLGVEHEKISVVFPGVNERFRKISNIDELKRGSLKYDLPENFILYVGGYDRRKNVETLLRSFQSLVVTDPSWPYQLVLGGRIPMPIPKLVLDFGSLVEQLGLRDRVRFTGYIEEEDIPIVYNLAQVFVYPSVYEGFGLPVLEAMACGVPTIAGRESSIREVLNKDDVLVDPMDTEALSRMILQLTSDPDRRKSLSIWGIERAKMFSWQSTSRATLDVYTSMRLDHNARERKSAQHLDTKSYP